MPSYLDCNATTPVEPEVAEVILKYTRDEYGNAGSRTHEYGNRAKRAVENARDQIRKIVQVEREELILTSGATESNNLAILGLAQHGKKVGKKHIVTTTIEHKAVLEPTQYLADNGYEVSIIPVDRSGRVSAEEVVAAVRSDTLLVSVMHANNETGVVQPIEAIAEMLPEEGAYFHVDAAQTFGKLIEPLRHKRIDMISASSHKVYGPKGIGCLVTRRRGIRKIPLSPLMFGGGQERGLRPGTMPVPLAVGFGVAAEMALNNHRKRTKKCEEIRVEALANLAPLSPIQNGDPENTMAHVLNISVPHVDAEAAMVALKGIACVSNGSACTSHSYTPSHVLSAMGLDEDEIDTALRISWSHLTTTVDWRRIREALESIRT